ncbi:hypothetical protein MXE38_02910 [Anaerobiospirillum sp. NML120448]|uniref:hypothetical protein n=1 Tax=Anaerobiospirillum sp. NML120448 TaxID=2932816 RepID=UPI001FF63A0F|nr:hypothetical protein [Anaerobiospirillum sp. NML120448]MCK0513821.1 hypothetical protein [Anaerobiospirillum sp. NML120448]
MQALVLVLVLAKTFFAFNNNQLATGTTTHLKCVKAMIAKPSKEHCHYEKEKGVKEIERERKKEQAAQLECLRLWSTGLTRAETKKAP